MHSGQVGHLDWQYCLQTSMGSVVGSVVGSVGAGFSAALVSAVVGAAVSHGLHLSCGHGRSQTHLGGAAVVHGGQVGQRHFSSQLQTEVPSSGAGLAAVLSSAVAGAPELHGAGAWHLISGQGLHLQ